MDPILFIDASCTFPYDLETYKTRALGGTEATVVRLAQKLSEKRPVIVAQHIRRHTTQCGNVTYVPLLENTTNGNFQSIVVLRNFQLSLDIRARCPNVPVWLWLHDLVTIYLIGYLRKVAKNNIGIITVSDFLKQQIINLKPLDPFLHSFPNIVRIYNPIDDLLVPDNTIYDANTLAFVSSPHKGLNYTLEVFKDIHKQYPFFELLVTNPGYFKTDTVKLNIPGVKNLGYLNHAENIQLMRKPLCLFYLNNEYPETFGLVLAEANAVGTPVLTHPLGATPEVLGNHDQLIDTSNIEAVTERLLQWHQGARPIVKANEAFRLSTIVKQWEDLL